MLKETIDRLCFDLDELRNASARQSRIMGMVGGGGAEAGLSRNLGKEMADKLAAEQIAEPEEEEAEEVETVTTTRRKIVCPLLLKSKALMIEQKKRATKSDSGMVETEEAAVLTVVVDAHAQTESISTHSIQVQTEELPSSVVHSRESTSGKSTALPPSNSATTELRQRPPSSRWARRLSSRLPAAAAEAPAYIINVFPESTRPLVSCVLTSKLVLYTSVPPPFILRGAEES